MHLLIALVTGTQSAAFGRQLADLPAARLALPHQATHDGLTGLPNRARLAARLGASVRPGDLAGRLGGDEFLVLLPHADATAADKVVTRIRDAVRAPMRIGGHAVTVGVSIGVAVRPAGGHDRLDALTAAADAAMYAAKSRTRATADVGGPRR